MAEIFKVTELPKRIFDLEEPRTYEFPNGSSITVGCAQGVFEQETWEEFEARIEAEYQQAKAVIESDPKLKAAFDRECALEPDALKRWLS